jgi:hypothetical protein
MKRFMALVCARGEVSPTFVHNDKDFQEIGAVQVAWPKAKIQLCYWHVKRAIGKRLAKLEWLAIADRRSGRNHPTWSSSSASQTDRRDERALGATLNMML